MDRFDGDSLPRVHGWADRAALRHVLDTAEQESAFVEVTAGRGAGKTVLLRSWCERASDRREYVDAGLDRTWASRVEDSVSARAASVTIVVDGVEQIRTQGARERLREIVRDTHGSVVLSGRKPVMELGAPERRLVRIGAADLRFGVRETDDLLRGCGVELASEMVLELVDRTEGRAALVALAAEVLVRSPDPAQVVIELSYSPDTTADALAGALLETLPPGEQEAVMALAAVPAFGDALAAELTGRPHAGAMIERIGLGFDLLRHVPPPVTGEPAGAGGYAWDETLRRSLHAQQRRRDAHRLTRMHATAGRWFARAGDLAAALAEAVESGDVELVDGLLRRHGLGLVFSGAVIEVREAVAALEDRGVLTSSTALLAALVSSPHLTDSVRVDHFLALAADDHDPAPERVVVVTALRALRATDDESAEQALDSLQDALRNASLHPHGEGGAAAVLDARIFAQLAKAQVRLRTGHPDDALLAALAAADAAEETARPWLQLLAIDVAAGAASSIGNWELTRALELRIGRISDADSPLDSLVAAAARVRIAAAAYRSCTPFRMADLTDIIQAHWRALDVVGTVAPRALLLLFRLDAEPDAKPVFEDMARLFSTAFRRHPETLAAVSFRFIDLTLRYRGRKDARAGVEVLAEVLGRDALEVAVGSALLQEGTPGQAAAESALEGALEDGRVAWQGIDLVYAWLLLAEWAFLAGNEDAARTRLLSALELAERMDARRPFLARDGAFAQLVLQQVGGFGPLDEFAGSVLDVARAAGLLESPVAQEVRLTVRERVILLELPLHQSIPAIAAKHGVSPNTIKTHLRSIYAKIGAKGRADAVQRARHLGLL